MHSSLRKKKHQRKWDLTDERIPPLRVVLHLTWPLFLEQVLTTLVSYADTAMVGVLGVQATASISITNPFVFLINGVMMALGVGITSYVARSVGAKDYEAAKAYIRHALLLLVCVGLPLCTLILLLHRQIPLWMGAASDIIESSANYLKITSIFRIGALTTMMLGSVFRGRGDMKTPLYINAGVNVLNIAGNYLLINPSHIISLGSLQIHIPGAGLGITGAALSTGFSWLTGGALMIAFLYLKDDPTRIHLREPLHPDWGIIRRIVSVSIPTMLERFFLSGASIVVSRAVASLGTVVYAANSVYITAESISFMPGFAFAATATTLTGQSLGAHKPYLAKRYVAHTVAAGMTILSITGTLIYFFAPVLVRLFTPDAAAIAIAVDCLHKVAFIQPIQVAGWIIAGALRGAGDTRWPFYITATCNWLIRALGAYVCIRVLHLGLPQAVLCACVDSCVSAFVLWLRYRSNRWILTIRDHDAKAA